MERTCRRVRMRRASAAFPKGYHGCDRERFDRLVRACCAMTEQLQAPFEGVLELDETTFGGARKGKRGWCAAGKVAVLGLIKRNGQAKIMPIAAHDRASVMQQIAAHSREGSLTTRTSGRPPHCPRRLRQAHRKRVVSGTHGSERV